MSEREEDEDVGYKKPPKRTQFGENNRANPGGRPKGRHIEPPYEAVLGQMVTIREGGEERRVTAEEAFLLHLSKQGLEKGGSAARTMMNAIGEARAAGAGEEADGPMTFDIRYIRPGTVTLAMEPLRMARKLDRSRKTARVRLETWIVEAALARFKDRRLDKEEQNTVERATLTPHTVNWPDWWTIRR